VTRSTRNSDTPRTRSRRVLHLEPLEDRSVPAVFTVNSLADVASGAYNPADNVVTLREAVERANALAGADTIRFAANLRGTITLAHGELTISDDLTVRGNGAGRLAVSGGGESRVLFVDEGATVAVFDLTIRDGSVFDFGGGIFNEGDLTLTRVNVVNNMAVSDELDTSFGGGGIENRGTLTLWYSRVANNTLWGTQQIFEDIDNGGGGIDSRDGADLNIYYSVITGNDSFNAGGIRSADSTFTMVGSAVTNNTAFGIVGGGMALAVSVNDIHGSVIAGNRMAGDFGSGAGFSNDSSITTLDGCVVSGNTATGYGGGIVVASVQEGGASSVTATDTVFSDNKAFFGGAFAVIDGSALNLDDCTLTGNLADVDGGAIWIGNVLDDFGLFFGNCDVTITDSAIRNNTAGGNGGGIFLEVADTLVLDGVRVARNHADGTGGGLYIQDTPDVFDISGALIVLNAPDNVVVVA
jgi:hypothetical protein